MSRGIETRVALFGGAGFLMGTFSIIVLHNPIYPGKTQEPKPLRRHLPPLYKMYHVLLNLITGSSLTPKSIPLLPS
jgi:hypothetical protein